MTNTQGHQVRDAEYQHIKIVVVYPEHSKRTTAQYDVINHRTGTTIGRIQWHGTWRQFCFFPGTLTVWSAGCLADVQDFLKQLAEERRQHKSGAQR